MEYLVGQELELQYYDPKRAPAPIKSLASGVDEVLVYQGPRTILFVN